VIKSLAQIEVYLNDGIIITIEDKTKRLVFLTWSNFKIDDDRYNNIGIDKAKKQNKNLNILVSVIILVMKDNMIKCNGVWTSVQSFGSANKFSCKAKIKP